MMRLERIIHSLYVFFPVISLFFFQSVTGFKNRIITGGSFIVCIIFLFFVHTELYFYDFWFYPWGMIAKGGPAFVLWSTFGMICTFYILWLFIRKMRTETNKVVRLKIQYLFISFFILIILTITNLPAMNGVDFYPLSNFIFIPLGIMTYGLLRYRLVDISSAVHMTLFWLVLSSLIIIPNLFVIINVERIFSGFNLLVRILIFSTIFSANFFYFDRIQPLINSLINRNSYNIRKTEKMLAHNITLLKKIDVLRREVETLLERTLGLGMVKLFLCSSSRGIFTDDDGKNIRLDDNTMSMLVAHSEVYIQKSIIERDDIPGPAYRAVKSLLQSRGCEYLLPLVNQEDLIGFLFLSEKKDRRQFNNNEFRFIKNFSAYLTIALANSVMYHNLSEIRDRLEVMVDERTAVIEKQKAELEEDMQFARKIQMSLLPGKIPDIPTFRIAYRYEPIMGVGGDFLDIHYREGMDDLGLFICDVSGHGASSAMIASMVKVSLNSWGSFVQQPAGAFVKMRELLEGKIGGNFITAFMCSVNIRTGVVTSACAGHPPMIVLRKSGEVGLIKPRGMVILDAYESEYEEISIRLDHGDILVLYTDGVVEARMPDGQMIGNDGFIAMLKRNAGLSAEELCSRIYDEIFSEDNMEGIEDDFALLVAEYV